MSSTCPCVWCRAARGAALDRLDRAAGTRAAVGRALGR